MNKLNFVSLLVFLFHTWQTQAQTTNITGPVGSGNYGKTVTALTNGNYVVADPLYDEAGITDRGAIYLYEGITHTLISTLKGGTLNDQVGSGGVKALTNGNFVVISPLWNGVTTDVGAVTWGHGTTGVAGLVSSTNSLVGSTVNDQVGVTNVTVLSNGNYVVCSQLWNNAAVGDAGAVTWGSGTTGISGAVNSTNSLVGTKANDLVGIGGVTALTNGNYVVRSQNWGNTAALLAGAVTWGNGTTGISGAVSSTNSLVGTQAGDAVGEGGITALTNGNYVTRTGTWDRGAIVDAGAATWGSGTTGISGAVTSTNSLVGNVTNDGMGGNAITALSNGNYVVSWIGRDNGAIVNAGAATWGNGTTGISGSVTNANSLVGSSIDDNIGSGGVVALTNGNYVVQSSVWNRGGIVDAGAATWGNGTTGITGTVSSTNSLVGSQTSDQVSINVVALANGNYVVRSSVWDNGATIDVGAATWGNGITGITGSVTTVNSLFGSSANDKITSGGVTALTNGNYVVRSQLWDRGATVDAGAVTWGNGIVGITGAVTTANSLVGSSLSDNIGNGGITALSNGNYVVRSVNWDGTFANVGAITWGNGITGTTGTVDISNSLVGSTAADNVGSGGVTALSNGNYVVLSPNWDNGALVNAGAVTYGIGSIGTSGIITNCNSVLGGTASPIAPLVFANNNIYEYLIVGRPSENIVSIYRPSGMGLAINLDDKTVNIVGIAPTLLLPIAACRIIATVTPNGAAPASGNVFGKVWVEATQPAGFVKRHYEITPQTNPTTATGLVTLYFTQTEFDNFNALYSIKLPTGPADASGIANLLVEERRSSTNDGTGFPSSYTGTVANINPSDANIIWNAILSRWEVSFDVTGFGGLFVKTGVAILPSKLLSFSAVLSNNDGLVNWKTANEIATLNFDVERSTDGRVFVKAGTVTAFNTAGEHIYRYTDAGITALNVGTIHYRLKQTDKDGRYTYSSIVSLHLLKNNSISCYPNPASEATTLRISNSTLLHTTAMLTDFQGKQVKQFIINNYQEQIDIRNLPKGIYVIKLADGTAIKLNKK